MLDIHNDHTHDLGLLQGKEYNYLDKQIIEKQTVHAPDLLGDTESCNNIIEGLVEGYADKDLVSKLKNNISDDKTNFNIYVDELTDSTSAQQKDKPYRNKIIESNGKYAYINNFGYKHEYNRNDKPFKTRNNKCKGKYPPCPTDCNTCKSGNISTLDNIIITTVDNKTANINDENIILFTAETKISDDAKQYLFTSNFEDYNKEMKKVVECPDYCKTCKEGGKPDRGVALQRWPKNLDEKKKCTEYCSKWGYCGTGYAYVNYNGTPCHKCAYQPVIQREAINDEYCYLKLPEVDKYISATIGITTQEGADIEFKSEDLGEETANKTFKFKFISMKNDRFAKQHQHAFSSRNTDNLYAITLFNKRMYCIDGKMRLIPGVRTVNKKHKANFLFMIEGLTPLPPPGGVSLKEEKCTEHCFDGYCGKGDNYNNSDGVDCTKCDDNDDMIKTVDTQQFNDIGKTRIAYDINYDYPCNNAGKIIARGNKEGEHAWVDESGVKHVFRNQDKNTWNKECSEEEKETVVLPINEYDVIIAGEKWENTDQCIASQASITARENKDKSQADMIRTQNKILNTADIEPFSTEYNNDIADISKHITEYNHAKINDISMSAKEADTRLAASSNKMHFYFWLLIAIFIVFYYINIKFSGASSLYDHNALTVFNWQNCILFISCAWIISSVWKWRPAWMRSEWYTLPKWLR